MLQELEQVFTGAMIRAVAGIVDVGELILAHFSHPDGGAIAEVADDRSDVYVHGQCSTDEVATGMETSRLFIPQNMLFNLPSEGESYIVARGKDAAGPGKSFALYGDCGAANQVPSWLDDSNAGISHKKTVHVESTENDVKLNADGNIDLTGTVVNINGTDYSLLKTDTFLTDLATCIAAINTAVYTTGSLVPTNPPDIAGFLTKLGSGAYKSTKAKNG